MPKSGNFSPAFLGSLTPATTNSYSQEENDAKEAHFDYLDRKIEYEKEELNKTEK